MDKDSILRLPHSNRWLVGARATPRTRGPRDAYVWVREGSFPGTTAKPSGMKPLARPARLGRQKSIDVASAAHLHTTDCNPYAVELRLDSLQDEHV